MSPAEWPDGELRIGEYRLVGQVGAGGMGVVYRALRSSDDRVVALKVLGPALGRDSDIARFRREAQAVARLDHPGIVAILDAGQDGRVGYLAMEYVDGASLRRVIDHLAAATGPVEGLDAAARSFPEGGAAAPVARFDATTPALQDGPADTPTAGAPTPEAGRLIATEGYVWRCVEVARDAAEALAHAHGRGVVHRDIKPENLLLDARGRVRIIDFGLARSFEDLTLTSTGALLGTPAYMSPEQVLGRAGVDARTDVYSLGLVLYELLGLRRAIDATTREAALRQVVYRPLSPTSRRNPAVPADLEAVVHKATAKDPDDRYRTAAEFADDLRRVLEGRPVAAPRYRYREDAREAIAERPRAVLVAALILLGMGLGNLLNVLWVAALEGTKQVAPWATLSLALMVVARFLLAGRTWARRAALAAFALALANGAFWTAIALDAVPAGMAEPRIEAGLRAFGGGRPSHLLLLFLVYQVLVGGLGLVAIGLLLSRASSRWFGLVARLHVEAAGPDAPAG